MVFVVSLCVVGLNDVGIVIVMFWLVNGVLGCVWFYVLCRCVR